MEWDAYLTRYSGSHPFSSDRGGTFEPYQSFWARLFSGNLFKKRSAPDRDMLFPPDSQLLSTSANPHKGDEVETTFTGTAPPSFRPYPFTASRKPTLLAKGKTRSPLKGGIASDSSDLDSSDDDGGGPPKFKPWVMKEGLSRQLRSDDVGALNSWKNWRSRTSAKVQAEWRSRRLLGREVDVTAAVAKMAKEEKEREKERNSPGWKPGFTKKHEEEVQRRASLKGKDQEWDEEDVFAPPRLTESPTPLSRHASSSVSRGPITASRQQSRLAPPTPKSLPATALVTIVSTAPDRNPSPTTPNANPSTFQTPRTDGSATASARTGSPTLAIDDEFWEQLRAESSSLWASPIRRSGDNAWPFLADVQLSRNIILSTSRPFLSI
ncbi:hypothetical protein FS837_001343 [Tulasnella sp. UAMH 9824]|nr:hypothetical protein FS837_001343 [Tulasnella sp. UAMH 9824]